MTTRRAARAFTVPLVLVLATVAGFVAGPAAPPSRAQTSSVNVTLLAQTPWTTPDDPDTREVESELRIALVATNTGLARVGDLDVAITLGPAVVSRFQFEATITEGPSSEAFSTAVPFVGRLDPGTARTLTVRLDMASVTAVSTEDSRVYPLRVEVRSGGVPVASLSTPAIHLVRTPEKPVRLAWWTEMSSSIAFDPQGRLVDPSLEAAVAPGGSLAAQLAAIGRLTDARGPRIPIDLAIEPVLLDQVAHLAAGYIRSDGTEVPGGEGTSATAAAFLEQLRSVAAAAEVQVSGQPFSGPSIPAMLAGELDAELTRQIDAGERTLDQVLGVSPASTVARPPGGLLDDDALDRLVANGVDAVLADADEVDRPAVGELGFAPLPTATIATGGGRSTMLVLPDPGTQDLFVRPDLLADPVRAAQTVLAYLAVIWKEQPNPPPQPDGTETIRGLAIAPPPSLPPTMWQPLLDRVSAAPFLTPEPAQNFVVDVSPAGDADALRAPDTGALGLEYAADIIRLRRGLAAYTSMLTEPSPVPARLRSNLLYATAREYLPPNEPAGRPWLDEVDAVTSAAFRSATPPAGQLFTFTAREGTIPLRMGDPGPVPLQVTVQLQASQFDFPSGDRQEVVLERPDQIVSFDVEAKVAGRNKIHVLVLAPSGQVINEQDIIVASTAVNRIALLITLGAAAMLLLLYGRRRARRKKLAS